MCPAKTQVSLGIRPVWSESSLSAHWAVKVPRFLHADSEDSDQKGRMPSLIWVFTGHIGHFVGFVMLRLFLIFLNSLTVFEKETRILPTTDPSLFDRVGYGETKIFLRVALHVENLYYRSASFPTKIPHFWGQLENPLNRLWLAFV